MLSVLVDLIEMCQLRTTLKWITLGDVAVDLPLPHLFFFLTERDPLCPLALKRY